MAAGIEQRLWHAVKFDNVKDLVYLLTTGVDLNKLRFVRDGLSFGLPFHRYFSSSLTAPFFVPFFAQADGDTLLHAALKANALQSVAALLEHGASVDVPNSQGDTLVHAILKRPVDKHTSDDIMARVLKARADLNAVGMYGASPLRLATNHDKFKALTLLLQLGADEREVDEQQNSLLHYAAWRDSDAAMRALLPVLASEVNAPSKVRRDCCMVFFFLEWGLEKGTVGTSTQES